MALLAAAALVVAACSSTPSTEEAADNLCSSLAGLSTSVASALTLSGDTTGDEAESGLDAVKSAWEDVKADAEVVNEAATQEAEEAIDALDEAVSDISGDSSLSDAAGQVATAATDFAAAIAEIAGSVDCG